jgi:hypothetical protein
MRQGPEQVVGALAGLDAADGEDEEPIRRPRASAQRGDHAWGCLGCEPVGVDAVRHHARLDAVLVGEALPPDRADHQHAVGIDDRAPLALDEGGRGEVVDVMHRPHDADRRTGIPNAEGGAGGDAVLDVQHRRQ